MNKVLIQLGNKGHARLVEGYILPVKMSDFDELSEYGIRHEFDRTHFAAIVPHRDHFVFAWHVTRIGPEDNRINMLWNEAEYYSTMVRGNEGNSAYPLASKEREVLKLYMDENDRILEQYRDLKILKQG
jgi:hypothetical protein